MPVMLDAHDAWSTYVHQVEALPPLSAAAERALCHRILEGGQVALQARRKLVEAHLEFVIEMAREAAGPRLDLADVVQEGNLALIEAAASYDPKADGRFADHVGTRVRQAIAKALWPDDLQPRRRRRGPRAA